MVTKELLQYWVQIRRCVIIVISGYFISIHTFLTKAVIVVLITKVILLIVLIMVMIILTGLILILS